MNQGSANSQELERRAGVIDMMLSMHCRLRDRYLRRALWLDLLILGVSVLICATVFMDPHMMARGPLGESGARVALGLASVVVFFLSIVSLRVDWKEAAGRHMRAVAALGDLKTRAQAVIARAEEPSSFRDEFLRLYDFTTGTLPPIPDAEFAALKAYHKRKVALSRELDRFPFAPLFVLRLKLAFRDSKSAVGEPAGAGARNASN